MQSSPVTSINFQYFVLYYQVCYMIYNLCTEEITRFGPATYKWVLKMRQKCTESHKTSKSWQKSKMVALLKPAKSKNYPKL